MSITPISAINWFWPAAILGITTLFFSGATVWLLDRQKKQKKYAWLVDIMAECIDKPMGMIVDKGGKILPFVIEHDKKNKGLLEHKRYTLIHPDLTPPETKHKMVKGPETEFYPLPGYFPLSIQDSAALVQLARDMRKDPRFSWISHEIKLLALLFNKTESFEKDARQLIKGAVVVGDEIPDDYLDREEEYEDEEYTEDDEQEDISEDGYNKEDDPEEL